MDNVSVLVAVAESSLSDEVTLQVQENLNVSSIDQCDSLEQVEDKLLGHDFDWLIISQSLQSSNLLSVEDGSLDGLVVANDWVRQNDKKAVIITEDDNWELTPIKFHRSLLPIVRHNVEHLVDVMRTRDAGSCFIPPSVIELKLRGSEGFPTNFTIHLGEGSGRLACAIIEEVLRYFRRKTLRQGGLSREANP